jgi:hypothetical protein
LIRLNISHTRVSVLDLRGTMMMKYFDNNGLTSFGTRVKVLVANPRLALALWAPQTDSLVRYSAR